MSTNKEQLLQSFWSSVKPQKCNSKKIKREVILTPSSTPLLCLLGLIKIRISNLMFWMHLYMFSKYLSETACKNWVELWVISKRKIYDCHHFVATHKHIKMYIFTPKTPTKVVLRNVYHFITYWYDDLKVLQWLLYMWCLCFKGIGETYMTWKL